MKLHLKVISGYRAGVDVELDQDTIHISRSEDADVQLHPTKDLQVGSKQHAVITREGGHFTVTCVHDNGVTLFANEKLIQLAQGVSATFTADAELAIGPNGPRVRCIPIGAAVPDTVSVAMPAMAQNMPVTEVTAGTIQKAEKSGGRIAGVAAVALLLVAGLAVAGYFKFRSADVKTGAQISSIEQGLEDTRGETERLQSDTQRLDREADSLAQGLVDQATQIASATQDIRRLDDTVGASLADLQMLNAAIDESNERLTNVQGQVAEIDAQAERDFSELLRRHSDSVAVVGIIDPGGAFSNVGTAWVVADTTLATNAHVVEGLVTKYDQLGGAGEHLRAVARFAGESPRDVEIDLAKARMHPGFAQMLNETSLHVVDDRTATLARYGPNGSIEFFRIGTGYDVGLLPTLTHAGEPLTLATEAQLRELASGTEIAYIGYPSEGLLGVRINAPPELHIGRLTSMTNFAAQADAFEKTLILSHSLPTVGGASGSPIFAADGTVIGLVSHGAIMNLNDAAGEPSRIMLGFNHGQRVTMLRELLMPNTLKNPELQREREIRRQLDDLGVVPSNERAYVRCVFAARNTLADLQQAGKLTASATLDADNRLWAHDQWQPENTVEVYNVELAPGTHMITCATGSDTDIMLVVIDEDDKRFEADGTTWVSSEAMVIEVPDDGQGTKKKFDIGLVRAQTAQAPIDLMLDIYPVRE